MGKDVYKGLSLRDQRILDMASRGKTAEQIASELAVPPARIVQEMDRLTKNVDWMSDLQKYKLQMHNLWRLMGSLQEAAESGHDSKITQQYIEAMKTAFDQLEKRSAKVDADLDRVNAAQAAKLMEIVEKSFYVTLGRLQERYPEVEAAVVEGLFQESILQVAAEIDNEGEQ